MNVFERFRDYFQGISDAFDDEKKASQIFKNTIDSGSTREDLFMEFLKRHLPKRTDVVKGGFIFDSSGNESKQIDLIVTGDQAIQFKQFSDSGGKSFNIIEACLGAFSIKTHLDKEQLINSLDNFASIPQTTHVSINPAMGNNWIVQDLPICVIFAFDGIDIQTIKTHLENYYQTNNVPENRKPDYIIVNNKYIITHSGRQELPKYDGTKIPPNTFYYLQHFDYVGGYSLWYMLTQFGGSSAFGPHTLVNFDPYTVKMIDTFNLPI